MRINTPLLLAGMVGLAIASPSLRQARSEASSSTSVILTVDDQSTDALSPDLSIKCLKDCVTIIGDSVCISEAIIIDKASSVPGVLTCVKNDVSGLCNCATCVTGAKALGAFLTKYDVCDALTSITTPP